MNPEKPEHVTELEQKRERHDRKMVLQALTLPQLIALAVQKGLMPYAVAIGQNKQSLVEGLIMIDDVLVPEEA